MKCGYLASMIFSVGADMKKLADLHGENSGCAEQLSTNVIAALGYSFTPRPAGGIAHIRFAIELTIRCVARSVALQAHIAIASRY